MYKLKLNKGLSYSFGDSSGNVITVTKKSPFCCVESENDANYLVSTGMFNMVDVPKEEKAEAKEKSVDEMTVNELKAYAADHDIDVSGCTKKAEYIEAINDSLESKNDSENENDIDALSIEE